MNDNEGIVWEGVCATPSQPDGIAPIIPVTVKRCLGNRDSFEITICCNLGSQMNMLFVNMARKNDIFINYTEKDSYRAYDIQGN